jgi:hypothetical protein
MVFAACLAAVEGTLPAQTTYTPTTNQPTQGAGTLQTSGTATVARARTCDGAAYSAGTEVDLENGFTAAASSGFAFHAMTAAGLFVSGAELDLRRS